MFSSLSIKNKQNAYKLFFANTEQGGGVPANLRFMLQLIVAQMLLGDLWLYMHENFKPQKVTGDYTIKDSPVSLLKSVII